MSGRKTPDLTGQTFGRWTVLEALPRDKDDPNDRQKYRCRCTCGNESNIRATDLINAGSSMCKSCAMRERGRKMAGRSPADVQAYLLTHTVTEAAEHWGLSHGSMTRYMERHGLKAVVKGKHRPKPPQKPSEASKRAFNVAIVPRYIPGINERSPHKERRWKYGGSDYLERMRQYERMVHA